MSKKNRLEQPYGYREEGKYVSGPAMICDAIKSKISAEELAEKLKDVTSKGFFGVRYARELESFVFTNLDDVEVATAKLYDIFVSDLIDTVTYDSDAKNVVINFENGDKIALPLSEVVDAIEAEAAAREEAVADILKKIGDMSDASDNEHVTLVDMIKQEMAAREEGDNALDAKIDEEANRAKEEEEAIKSMIDEVSSSLDEAKTELTDMVEQEKQAREEGDNQLQEAISSEAATREEIDNQIQKSIEEEVANRNDVEAQLWAAVNGEVARAQDVEGQLWTAVNGEITRAQEVEGQLWTAVNTEIAARENGDKSIWEAIGDLTEASDNGDKTIVDMLKEETAAREQGDKEIWDSIGELSENGVTLTDMIAQETAAREAADSELKSEIEAEAAARESADNDLNSAIEDEVSAREAADSELKSEIEAEAAAREELQKALDAEIENREAAEEEIKNAMGSLKIEKAEPMSTNVKEAYKLTNAEGEQMGETINVYKDSSLKSVELVGEKDGQSGQYLKFTYITEDGSENVVLLDVSTFLVESEFKDGFKVESSGEVNIHIDEASEDYLTVSENGLKLKGVDAIASDLDEEKNARETKDGELDTKITDGLASVNDSISELDEKVDNEITARDEADKALNEAIQNEAEARESGDNALSSEISSVKGDLESEKTARETKDSAIDEEIASLKGEDASLNSKITELENALKAEETSRTDSDNALQASLDKKANSIDVYYKGEADEKFATKEELPTDFYGRGYIDGKFNEVNDALTSETQTRAAEDANLNKMITAETKSRTDADTALQASVDAINEALPNKVDTITTDGVALSINKVGNAATINVNISDGEGQVLGVDASGLYAKVALEYNERLNTLLFKTAKNTELITLKTTVEIHKMYYTRGDETFTMEYSVNGQRMPDVVFSASDLINEWRVSEDTSGAIRLEKRRESGVGQDVLYAEVIVSDTHSDNALIKETGGALYVSKDDIIGGLEARVAELEGKLDAMMALMTLSVPNMKSVSINPNAIANDEAEFIEED